MSDEENRIQDGAPALSVALLLLAPLLGPYPEDEARPNVVLVMADDLGIECLGCYGSRSYETPHLDELAAQGVRFTHAFSQPLCTPSRVQIMTGRYNWRNYESFRWLDPRERTFAQALREQGYATAIVGKWQLSQPNEAVQARDEGLPARPDVTPEVIRDLYGFEEYLLWQLNGLGSRHWKPRLERNGELLETTKEDYAPDLFVDHAIDFMTRQRDAGRPFLLYYPMVLPHRPWVATPNSAPGVKKDVTLAANFGDAVEYIDALVGRLVRAVDELGLGEDTLIVFCGDNGTDRRILTKTIGGIVEGDKAGHTDRAMHVPFLVRWTGRVEPERVSDRLVDFTDVYPTLAALAGAPVRPGDVDGIPILNADGSLPDRERDAVYFWYEPLHGKPPFVAARSRRYKLYADGRFFDLQSSPDEKAGSELAEGAGSPEAEVARGRLQQVLESLGLEHTLGERDRIVPVTAMGVVGDEADPCTVLEFDLSAPEVEDRLELGFHARLRITVTGSSGDSPADLAVFALDAGEDGVVETEDHGAPATLLEVIRGLEVGETIDLPVTREVRADAGGWSAYRLQIERPEEPAPGASTARLHFGFDDGLDFGDGAGPNTTARIVLLETPP